VVQSVGLVQVTGFGALRGDSTTSAAFALCHAISSVGPKTGFLAVA
jgi:hypothetical protein